MSAQLVIGSDLAQHRIEAVAARGGMGVVYRATHTGLGRQVALKVVAPELAQDQAFRERFRRESKLAANLDHPNVIPVYEAGEEDGVLYITMRWVEGEDLSALIKRDGALAPIRAARIVAQVAAALDAAHESGLIHRDVKPANVLITSEDHAYLTDFGLTRHAGSLGDLTRSGQWVGTLDYVSPEQIEGQAVDPRSDVYSLGCVLYETLTGTVPYPKEGVLTKLFAHTRKPPPSALALRPELPEAFDRLLARAMAKDPAERYPSTGEFGREVLAAAEFASEAVQEKATGSRFGPIPLPSTVDVSGRDRAPFVGREQAIDELLRLWERAKEGTRQLAFLAGEPGVGKTRLAMEFALFANRQGASVLYGRSDQETLVPYQPFVEALGHYASVCPTAELEAYVRKSGGDLVRLIPELSHRIPDLPEPFQGEPETERYRFFEAASSLLLHASKITPLVLVLDDLHWADKPTLLLLRQLIRSPDQAPLLILGTYRESELERTHPLAETLAALRREQPFERISLQGLSTEAVGTLIKAWAGHEIPPRFARAVYEETEGNPFFIEEVLRHLVESRAIYRKDGRWTSDLAVEQMGIPEGVKEVISQRCSHLSEPTNRALSIAAIIGRDFDLDVLEQVIDFSGEPLLAALEEAIRARVIDEDPTNPDRFSFSHALIRETLYEDLSATRRGRLHLRIAEVMEGMYRTQAEAHLTELSYHYFQAAQGGDLDKAIDYAVRAGERATKLLAYEEAASHYERALRAFQLKSKPDESQRCKLLLALGDAHNRSGDHEKAKEKFLEAAELARRLEAPEQLAHAALGYGGGFAGYGSFMLRSDDLLVGLLEEALEALPETDSVLRVSLLGRLAVDLYHTQFVERREAAAREALEMAQRLGDPTAQFVALKSWHGSTWDPGAAKQRREAAAEMVQLAERSGDKEMAFHGHSLDVASLYELGDMEGADSKIHTCARLAEELRQPLYRWHMDVFRASRALLDGRLEEAERLTMEAYTLGQSVHPEVAFTVFGAQIFYVRWAQGRISEIDPQAVKSLAEQSPGVPGWGAALAFLYSQLGREEEARSEFESLAASNFEVLPRDGNWLVSIHLLSETCAFLRDSSRAEILYEHLLPYAELSVAGAPAVLSLGSVASMLGALAATMQRWDEAVAHFELALERNGRMGARPLTVRTLELYAQTLLARDRPEDRGMAFELMEQALEIARDVGMRGFAEEVEALRPKAQAAAT